VDKVTSKTNKKELRIYLTQQLETHCPYFNSLKRKEKRAVVGDVSKAAKKALEAGELSIPTLSPSERIGLGRLPEDVMSLEEMKQFIEEHERNYFSFCRASAKVHLTDPLLQCMDGVLTDSLLDRILAPPGMTPSKREWMPSQLLRIELLRTAKFPEWSVRKYCEYMSDLSRKQERCFCKLPLHRYEMCDHSTLSTFRSSLSFEMRVNLMVYLMHYFFESGHLSKQLVHMVDSTDVAIKVNNRPLEKIKMPDGTFIRFYSDLHCDCGSRRNKRDKSKMFVGYRVHTLCVADANSGIAFPLLSLAVAANHHDSQVFEPLLAVARAIGLELKVLAADEAYADARKQRELVEEYGTIVVTPPKSKSETPAHVDSKNGNVFCQGACETPMRWDGYDKEDEGHVFLCNAEQNTCPMAHTCPKERIVPMDTGMFGPIPICIPEAGEVIDLRKVTERPFNLIKHMDGLEPCRMKTQATVSAQVVFSQMIGIFKVMAGLRSMPQQEVGNRQEVLPFAANG